MFKIMQNHKSREKDKFVYTVFNDSKKQYCNKDLGVYEAHALRKQFEMDNIGPVKAVERLINYKKIEWDDMGFPIVHA